MGPSANHPGRSLRLPLLRSGALHAAARQLAELVGPLEAEAAVAGAEDAPAAVGSVDTATAGAGSAAAVAPGQSQVARPGWHLTLTEPAAACAGALFTLIYVTIVLSCDLNPAFRTPQALREALVAALEGSQVLEHAGRALLLLRLRVKEGTPLLRVVDEGTYQANWAHHALCQVVKLLRGQAGGQDASASEVSGQLAARLRAVASGRCAQHAALCLGLAVLCHADGGPAYGMPPELLAALPKGHESARDPRMMGSAAVAQLGGMIGMLELRVGAAAQPPGRRGALELTMRVGWLAVASARALAARSGSGAGGGGGGSRGDAVGSGIVEPETPLRVLSARDAFSIALQALQCARRFLLLGARPEAEGAVAEAAGWWRLVAAVAADVLPHADLASELTAFEGLMADAGWETVVVDGVFALPSEPPPALAAALDGGLLRCLERLLRRAGRAPDGPEAAVVRAVVGYRSADLDRFAAFLLPLLAYGEPRQAAALVATLRKLLRTGDPRVMSAETDVKTNIHQCFVLACESVLDTAFTWNYPERLEAELLEREEGEAVVLGAGPSPASQQLVRLLSCAVCEWLPELARGVMACGTGCLHTFYTLMGWLPLLSARCLSSWPCQPDGAASSSGEDGESDDGREPAADDGSGWRALLLEEVGAVTLLEAALKIPLDKVSRKSVRDFLFRLVFSCHSVASVCGDGQRPPPAQAAVGRSGVLDSDGAAAVTVGAAGEASRDAPTAGPSGAPTTPPLPWRPELLREAATQLRTFGDTVVAARAEAQAAARAEALAAYLEQCDGEELQRPIENGPLAAAVLPPAEARRLLPGRCANPACANLEGHSEADLTLKACAGCGAVGYCCRPCQLEHWRAGHKEACGRARGGGGA
ncbi:hypothetical protein GPECTOR_18g154 [Gonium pectorale]|uniref:phytol kinase n=1 Tax=Gonium pectorale TaxID=33097 RepID=A0A150GJK2_GONPE|nr:hypothetical protein GPECTOR_18g154 [Gonium pectorale]|eukprot:KXZ49999.1 hypothetical protein GPECTOR_18g154 [Gonium pectorale]